MKILNINEMSAAVEAILFAVGEPLEIERLVQALDTDEDTLQAVLENLSATLDENGSGVCLLRLDNKYQLCARKQYAQLIRDIMDVKRNAPLSQAALEVLAIIAYNQPITKSFVEQVRGVDCSAVISKLCEKSLVEEKGRLDLPGRPLVYGTTPEFLRCFCISSLDELPPVSDGEQMTFPENEKAVNEANEIKIEVSENEFKQKVDETETLG